MIHVAYLRRCLYREIGGHNWRREEEKEEVNEVIRCDLSCNVSVSE
jgi:hypothetical protein